MSLEIFLFDSRLGSIVMEDIYRRNVRLRISKRRVSLSFCFFLVIKVGLIL